MEHKTKNIIITILLIICLLLVFLLLFCPQKKNQLQMEVTPLSDKNIEIKNELKDTVPVIEEKDIDIVKVTPKISKPTGKTFFIKENLSRKMIYFPLPDCPEWLDDEKKYDIDLKLEINNKGIVNNIEIIKSSGLYELDDYLIKSVKNWKFEESEQGFENVPVKIKYEIN